ncbi:MAG: nucleotidyl transferase AbiEii/AbiGii toxin family protein [Candidatus Desulfofervidaceae bacterium]|nr:nucleotidyl transferase AbiEii/AbiGii toxin family protein [Candidatus Desulfofervidaceae bacterium]
MRVRTIFDIEKHRKTLIWLLVSFFKEPYLAQILGFKGGTALHFFFGLPRFSVDLDFNCITERVELGKVLKKILNMAKKGNLKVKDYALKKNTILAVFSYADFHRNIKIEISTRQWPDRYFQKQLWGIPFTLMVPECMFAHKLVAFVERKKIVPLARDAFDLWFMFKNKWEIDEEIVRLRTGKSLPKHLEEVLQIVKGLNSRNLIQGLGELLPPEQKKFVEKHLKEELETEIEAWLIANSLGRKMSL